MADFGPPERLARGEVRVDGEGRYRRGRAYDVISTFTTREQEAAAWLNQLFEAAEWTGYKCSRFNMGSGIGQPGNQTDRAEDARRMLWRVEKVIGPLHWLVIFHVMFFLEPQSLFAKRVRIRKADVRSRLRAALSAVADYRR